MPWTWNTFFAISKPIVVICMWTAPYVSHSNDHLTAIRRRERAPSTTSKREAALFGLMSASTSSGHNGPNAYRCLVPQADKVHCSKRSLLVHLVGAAEQLCWHSETEGLGSLKVDHQLELDRGLDGKIARLCALQYAIGIG